MIHKSLPYYFHMIWWLPVPSLGVRGNRLQDMSSEVAKIAGDAVEAAAQVRWFQTGGDRTDFWTVILLGILGFWWDSWMGCDGILMGFWWDFDGILMDSWMGFDRILLGFWWDFAGDSMAFWWDSMEWNDQLRSAQWDILSRNLA